MSRNLHADLTSEEGELAASPKDWKKKRFSDEEDVQNNVLEIKPPQPRSSKSRRHDERYQSEKHKRTKYREKHRSKEKTPYEVRTYEENNKHNEHIEEAKGDHVKRPAQSESLGERKEKVYKALEDFHKHLLTKNSLKDDIHRNKKRKSSKDGDDLVHSLETSSKSTKRKHKKDKKHKKEKQAAEEKAERKLRIEKLIRAERLIARLKEYSTITHTSSLQSTSKHTELEITQSKIAQNEVKIKREEFSEDSIISQGSQSFTESQNLKMLENDSSSDSTNSYRSISYSHESDSDNNINEYSKQDDAKEVKTSVNDELPPYYPAIEGCRSIKEFQVLNRIEEGTYGIVYRARDKRTDEIVALKHLKMEKEKEGFPITSLREINTLLKSQHPNIVTVREIIVGDYLEHIYITMDYVEHDLKSLMQTMRYKNYKFTSGEIKCLLKQLLTAVAHLHDNWILHRDLKTSNLLLSHKGILKVGDFGLAREYGSPLKAYTPVVVTLWYRAPELLLSCKQYSTAIDMWSVGCIFAEFLLMNPLFPGKSEVEEINRIFKDLGTPNETVWPGFTKLPGVKKIKFAEYPGCNLRSKFQNLSEIGLGLLTKLLTYDPVQRISAEDALTHAYFTEPPLPIDPSMFPTWPAKSELGETRAMAASPKPPSGGGEFKELNSHAEDDGFGFHLGIDEDNERRGGGFNLKF